MNKCRDLLFLTCWIIYCFCGYQLLNKYYRLASDVSVSSDLSMTQKLDKFLELLNDSNKHNSHLHQQFTDTLTFQPIGRLGNLMFEIASTVGIAMKNKRQPSIPSDINLKCFEQSNLQHYIPIKDYDAFHPGDLTFDARAFNLPQGSNYLKSVMQSWKYFGHVTHNVKGIFRFNPEIKTFIHDFYHNISQSFSSKPSTYVTVQIRRTDFIKDYSNLINGISMRYIKKAMELYHREFMNVKFLIVSDDIAWCRDNLPSLGYELIFSEGHTGCEDLGILAHANHSIITAGSSYGWWGAFMASGHVTYYEKWLKTGSWYNLQFTPSDYFLPYWTKLPN